LSSNSEISSKVSRLLEFYHEILPLPQVWLLSAVSLFRAPVAADNILRILRALFSEAPLPNDAILVEELRKLNTRGILTCEPINDGYGYACHPILRYYFREVVLRTGSATVRRAADILQGEWLKKVHPSSKEIEPVLVAIELLLDAGEFLNASLLFRDRLENGSFFKLIPALPEGLNCVLGFVMDEPRRKKCEEQISRDYLRFQMNYTGLFASLSGQSELAAHFYADHNAICREIGDNKNLSTGLRNQVLLSVHMGELTKGVDLVAEALELTQSIDEIPNSHSYRAWASHLLGRVQEAAEEFSIANRLEKASNPAGKGLYSLRGCQWAELLSR